MKQNIIEGHLEEVMPPKEYVKSLKQIEEIAKESGLNVADMPTAIRFSNILKIEEQEAIDVISSEFYGIRNETRCYEIWHSVGSLTSAEGLARIISNSLMRHPTYYELTGLFKIPKNEWEDIGNGYHPTDNKTNVVRLNINDLRKGEVPKAGTPYTVSMKLEEDYSLIPTTADFNEINEMQKSGKLIIFEKGELDSDQFRLDDRIAAMCGSPKNVEILHKNIFENIEDGGQGRSSITSYHQIEDAFYYDNMIGHNLIFSVKSGFFMGADPLSPRYGHFQAVLTNPELAQKNGGILGIRQIPP